MIRDEKEFCKYIHDFLEFMYKRERSVRKESCETQDYDPMISAILEEVAIKDFNESVKPYINRIVEASGMDLTEFAVISHDLVREKRKQAAKHREWYKKQEFDI